MFNPKSAYPFFQKVLENAFKGFKVTKPNIDRKNQLSSLVTDYVQSTGNRISDLKKEVHQVTKEKFPKVAHWITNFQGGELLKSLVMLQKGKKGLEIGVFTGFTALCMAEALPTGGKLYALDIDAECMEVAKSFWKKAGVDDRIEPLVGDALETLNQFLSDSSNLESFDFVFIDADKQRYPEYYEAALKLLKPRGVIIIDNVLFRGQPYINKFMSEEAENIKRLNRTIRFDSRVEHCNMIPISDGLTLVFKK